MQIIIEENGDVRMIYTEAVDIASLGTPNIRRGSHVEPTADGKWTADMSPVQGPTLGPFDTRSEALAAEVAYLEANWL